MPTAKKETGTIEMPLYYRSGKNTLKKYKLE